VNAEQLIEHARTTAERLYYGTDPKTISERKDYHIEALETRIRELVQQINTAVNRR
jgi:hypothetical protein